MSPPMLPGAPGATGLMLTAFWGAFAVWVASELWTQFRRRPAGSLQDRDRGSMVALVVAVWVALALAFAAAVVEPGASISYGRTSLFWLGVALMPAGIALRWSAILALGRAFTVKVSAPPGDVIQRGPYRWVRHPSYSGSLITIFGIMLCFVNLLPLLSMILPIAGYAYRIRVEEDVLLERMGERYRAYMGRTKRLVPFLI